MRWKTLVFLGKTEESKHKQNYGFLTRNCPAAVDYDFQLMIKNVVFKKVNNTFQTELSNDVKKIKDSNKIFAPANKSRNDEYQKLSIENITKI